MYCVMLGTKRDSTWAENQPWTCFHRSHKCNWGFLFLILLVLHVQISRNARKKLHFHRKSIIVSCRPSESVLLTNSQVFHRSCVYESVCMSLSELVRYSSSFPPASCHEWLPWWLTRVIGAVFIESSEIAISSSTDYSSACMVLCMPCCSLLNNQFQCLDLACWMFCWKGQNEDAPKLAK